MHGVSPEKKSLTHTDSVNCTCTVRKYYIHLWITGLSRYNIHLWITGVSRYYIHLWITGVSKYYTITGVSRYYIHLWITGVCRYYIHLWITGVSSSRCPRYARLILQFHSFQRMKSRQWTGEIWLQGFYNSSKTKFPNDLSSQSTNISWPIPPQISVPKTHNNLQHQHKLSRCTDSTIWQDFVPGDFKFLFMQVLHMLFEAWQSINYSFNYWHIFYRAMCNSLLFHDFSGKFAFSPAFSDQSNSLTLSVSLMCWNLLTDMQCK